MRWVCVFPRNTEIYGVTKRFIQNDFKGVFYFFFFLFKEVLTGVSVLSEEVYLGMFCGSCV